MNLLFDFFPIEIITVCMSKTMGGIVAEDHSPLGVHENLQLNSKTNDFPFVTFMVMSFTSILPQRNYILSDDQSLPFYSGLPRSMLTP